MAAENARHSFAEKRRAIEDADDQGDTEVVETESPEDLERRVREAVADGVAVIVAGGGDSALEAAHTIAEQPGTKVSISYRSEAFSRAKPKNRDKVADLGLSVRDVTEMLQTAVAGTKAGEFRSGGNAYRILVRLKNAEKRSLEEILDLTLTTASGEKVTLRNVVTTESSRGPILIDHKDQQRQMTVRANVANRDLSSVATEVQSQLNMIPRPKPSPGAAGLRSSLC